MKSYTIHFIRHGLTQSNEKGVYAGQTDCSLSERGQQELLDLKEKFKYPESSLIYCSPLKRCLETAQILYPDITPIIIDQLKECSFGEWEGKSVNDLKGTKRFISWIKSKREIAPPKGEAMSQFSNRVCEAFDKIVTGMMKTGQTKAIIVTHGGVIMSILSTFGIPKSDYYEWIVDNGCGYSVRITPSLWMRDKVMEVYEQIPRGHTSAIKGDFKFLIDFMKDNSTE